MTLKEFQEEINRLNQWAQHGCRNGGCRIEQPKGMATNGPCHCSPRKFSRILLDLAAATDGKYSWDQ